MHLQLNRTRLVAGTLSVLGALGLGGAFVPTASAQTTGPSEPIAIGGATNSTITGVTINAEATTEAVVEPSSSLAMSATLTLGNGVDPGHVYWAAYGWSFATSAAAMSAGVGGVGSHTTTNFNLTAPATAGIYEVTAALGQDPVFWHVGSTIAVVVVTSYDSVCTLAQSYSTDPAVAAGLCDKLDAAKQAADRGSTKAAGNILHAFDNQVAAQTGKALTSDQAATLTTLASFLLPSG